MQLTAAILPIALLLAAASNALAAPVTTPGARAQPSHDEASELERRLEITKTQLGDIATAGTFLIAGFTNLIHSYKTKEAQDLAAASQPQTRRSLAIDDLLSQVDVRDLERLDGREFHATPLGTSGTLWGIGALVSLITAVHNSYKTRRDLHEVIENVQPQTRRSRSLAIDDLLSQMDVRDLERLDGREFHATPLGTSGTLWGIGALVSLITAVHNSYKTRRDLHEVIETVRRSYPEVDLLNLL